MVTRNSEGLRLLFIDSAPGASAPLLADMAALGCRPVLVESVAAAVRAIGASRFAVCVLHVSEKSVDSSCAACLADRSRPLSRLGQCGAAALCAVVAADPDMAVVVLTETGDEEAALAVLRQGAQDYIARRDADAKTLVRGIRYAAERKRAETELRESKLAAERANRAKSQFLANMSHELRTPLNAVLGFSEVLALDLYGPLPEVYRDYARDIHSSGTHLLDLVNKVLDLSKVEAGKWGLAPEAFAVREVVEESLATLRKRASDKNVALVADCEPITMVADRCAAKQCLLNLLANAVKYTGDGGVVTVRAAREGGDVVLSVADTGVGIPPEDLPRMGRPFEQAANSLPADGARGTGLGLALTKALIELHGGSLALESELGRGTTAVLRFPARSAAATAA